MHGESLTEWVERKTMRKLTMHTSLQDHISKCHPQTQSPLFSVLPKEIRDMVFEYATAQYEDLEHAYPEDADHYRPGYRGPHRTSPSLLQTCRLIWLETNALPMRQYVLTFWSDQSRGPPKQPGYEVGRTWTRLNKDNFTTLQIFSQPHMLRGIFQTKGEMQQVIERLQPKTLRITIRYTDLTPLEHALPLPVATDWLQIALDASWLSSVHTLHVELEILEQWKDQLRPILSKLVHLRGKARPTTTTHSSSSPSSSFQPTSSSSSSNVPPTTHTQFQLTPPSYQTPSRKWTNPLTHLPYTLYTLTWTRTPCASTAQATPLTEVVFSTPRILFQRPRRACVQDPELLEGMRERLARGWGLMEFRYWFLWLREGEMEREGRTRREMMGQRFAEGMADAEAGRMVEK